MKTIREQGVALNHGDIPLRDLNRKLHLFNFVQRALLPILSTGNLDHATLYRYPVYILHSFSSPLLPSSMSGQGRVSLELRLGRHTLRNGIGVPRVSY